MGLIRTEPRRGKSEEVATVCEAVLGERRAQDLQGLEENLDVGCPVVRVCGGIEIAGLQSIVAPANANLEPPTGELIEQRQVLGQTQGMPESDDRGGKPEAYPLSARCNVGRHHQRIAKQLPTPDAKVVFGQPEG